MTFIKQLVLFILLVMSIFGCSPGATSSQYYLFVGTYTGEGSEGIYLYRFNAADGSVDSIGVTKGVKNPSYLALSPDQSNIYAVNERADSSEASVSAFSFDKAKEQLTFLNKQSSLGSAPCYVSVDKKGKAVFVGNYGGGSVAVYPIQKDGSLGKPGSFIQHRGSSVNKSRQNSPHVHCTIISPDNGHLLVSDLGTDKVYGYSFNDQRLQLQEKASFIYQAEAGAGPRHLTFHPGGAFAYLVNELNGSVVAFDYRADSLRKIQSVSMVPSDYKGTISGADIHLSPDGKFLYVSNRGSMDNIVIYAVDQGKGTLKKIGVQSSGGEHPRNFVIDPTGNYLLVANRNTDNIVIFKRDKEDGSLSRTGEEIKVSQPVCLKFISK